MKHERHRLDLVLSDQRMPEHLSMRAYNHLLGESGMSFLVQRKKSRRYRSGFPDRANRS